MTFFIHNIFLFFLPTSFDLIVKIIWQKSNFFFVLPPFFPKFSLNSLSNFVWLFTLYTVYFWAEIAQQWSGYMYKVISIYNSIYIWYKHIFTYQDYKYLPRKKYDVTQIWTSHFVLCIVIKNSILKSKWKSNWRKKTFI